MKTCFYLYDSINISFSRVAISFSYVAKSFSRVAKTYIYRIFPVLKNFLSYIKELSVLSRIVSPPVFIV